MSFLKCITGGCSGKSSGNFKLALNTAPYSLIYDKLNDYTS